MNLVSSKERLLQYLNYKSIKTPKFYEETGINRGLLDSDKLKSTLTDVFIAKIIETYPEPNIF